MAGEKRKVALETGAAGPMELATAKGLPEDRYAVVMADVEAACLRRLLRRAPLGFITGEILDLNGGLQFD